MDVSPLPALRRFYAALIELTRDGVGTGGAGLLNVADLHIPALYLVPPKARNKGANRLVGRAIGRADLTGANLTGADLAGAALRRGLGCARSTETVRGARSV